MNRMRRVYFTSLMLLFLALTAGARAGDGPKPDGRAAANGLSVCGCGKVFLPDEKTEYVSCEGEEYACCSHECHVMADRDPKAAATMSRANLNRLLTQLAHLRLGVANVIAVTEQGTAAVCGCGKEFLVDGSTEYLHLDDRAYACCSRECHLSASKDLPAAVQMIENRIAERH